MICPLKHISTSRQFDEFGQEYVVIQECDKNNCAWWVQTHPDIAKQVGVDGRCAVSLIARSLCK